MIDEISFKILNELSQDGRSSYAKLAQKLDINISTVTKKVREMLKNDIITIKAIPNPSKMGYRATALIGLCVDSKGKENICYQLKANHNIHMIVNSFGRFDIMFLTNFREWETLHNFLKIDLLQIKGIRKIDPLFISDSDNILEDNKISQKDIIDETNKKLILRLMQNGRANYADLARDFNISLSTVSKRIDSLLKENIIKIVGIPNHAKLGYSLDAFIAIHCELDKINNICTKLKDFVEIHMIKTLINGYDILFGLHSLNIESLYQFLKNNIDTMDGVLHTETFILGNYYSYFYPDTFFNP